MANWNHGLSGGQGLQRQRSVHRQDAVLTERGLDQLRVAPLRQQELPVVLPVHGLGVGLFLVLGVDLKCFEFEISKLIEVSRQVKTLSLRKN